MVNKYYVRRIDKNRNMCNNLMNNQNIMFVISLPYEKVENVEIKNKYVLMNDENISFDIPLSTWGILSI